MARRRNPNSRKRAATNIVMFIGLGALALVAWYDINGELPDRRVESVQHTVEHMTVVRGDGQTFAFAREGANWQLRQPVNAPAAGERVSRLVALIDTNTENGYAIDEIDLDATGLSDPPVRMRLGDDTAVFFGGIEPVSGRRYVQIDDRVVLLDDQHVPLIDGGLNAFAERQPFSAAIDSVSISGQDADAAVWQSLTALGVKPQLDGVSTNATAVDVTAEGTSQTWHAWQDGALVALHRAGDEVRYLISTADAATLGLSF